MSGFSSKQDLIDYVSMEKYSENMLKKIISFFGSQELKRWKTKKAAVKHFESKYNSVFTKEVSKEDFLDLMHIWSKGFFKNDFSTEILQQYLGIWNMETQIIVEQRLEVLQNPFQIVIYSPEKLGNLKNSTLEHLGNSKNSTLEELGNLKNSTLEELGNSKNSTSEELGNSKNSTSEEHGNSKNSTSEELGISKNSNLQDIGQEENIMTLEDFEDSKTSNLEDLRKGEKILTMGETFGERLNRLKVLKDVKQNLPTRLKMEKTDGLIF